MGNRKLMMATGAAAVALGLVLSGCSAGGETAAEGDVTLSIATQLENDTFDPALLTGGVKDAYWQAVYDTLLVRDVETMELQPNVATAWEWDETGTVLTMELREDVTFTDGSPLDAEAVAQNALRLRDADASSSFMMQNVVDVNAVDTYEVQFTLDAPNPAFLGYLATMGGVIGNPAAFDEDIATTPAGSGPYVYNATESVAGTTYVYERNDDYWNKESYPYDRVVLTPIVEQSARLNALKTGQVNAGLFDTPVVPEAEAAGLQIERTNDAWQGLFLADRMGALTPALADVRVRQAINYAIDGDAILESIFDGEGTPTTQVFNPGDIGYVDALDDRYPYDPDLARELLADAGYADGFDLAIPAYDWSNASQPIVIQQLGEVGIRVTPAAISPSDYLATVKGPNYSAFFMNLTSGDPWRNASKLFPADSTWNSFSISDATLDDLMKRAALASAVDPDEYRELMGEISEYVVENAFMAVMYRPNSVFISDGSFEASFNPYSSTPELKDFRPVN